jgi:integrase
MVRPRTGTVRFRGGSWHASIRLRTKKSYERKVEQPTDGGPYDEAWARLFAAKMARDYGNRTWDPEAPKAPPTGNPFVIDYARKWVKAQTNETAPKDLSAVNYYLARSPFGAIKIRDVKPIDAAHWIEWLVKQPSRRGGKVSASVVRNAYDLVQRAFDRAALEQLLVMNPLRIARKELPAKVGKASRENWTFTHEEIETLISSPKVKADRRLRYALLFLTGMRFGESGALRWRDWDRRAEPLTRITVSRAIKSVSRAEKGTKTGAVKRVPVHPTLLPILTEWHTAGWRAAMGREPTLDDLVIPSVRGRKKGQPANTSAANRAFKADQESLGMKPRHQHVARHAFISLAQDDGAPGDVLRWVTHAPPSSAFNGYTRGQWRQLCEAVSMLKVGLKVG